MVGLKLCLEPIRSDDRVKLATLGSTCSPSDIRTRGVFPGDLGPNLKPAQEDHLEGQREASKGSEQDRDK